MYCLAGLLIGSFVERMFKSVVLACITALISAGELINTELLNGLAAIGIVGRDLSSDDNRI